LVFDLLELLLFGTDDALAAFAAFLHPAIDPAVQLRLQFVAVLHFGTQEPPALLREFIRDARAQAVIHSTAWDESTAACGGLKPLFYQL
jgi:hypothetical protein